jgi:uncharacterized protein YjdB
MVRFQAAVWLLLAASSRTSECRLATGPDGLCAFFRLEPSSTDLRLGGTLRVRVNGLTCERGSSCLDCADRSHRVRWTSSAPDIASVDSTGVVRALRAGRADIRLDSDDGTGAGMQVVVTP